MDGNLSADLSVPFLSGREAEIAYNTLNVDQEPKRGGAKKSMKVEGSTLHLHITAREARVLRVSLNSFLDHLALVVQTMEQFGPPVCVDGEGDNS